MQKCGVLLILAATFCSINSYKILAILPMPSYSHYVLHEKIIIELANRGHEVTAINPFPQKTPVKNLKDISTTSVLKIIEGKKKDFLSLESGTVAHHTRFITNFVKILTELTLKHENVQKLLHSNEEFDLILAAQYLNDALMGFQHRFKVPVVYITTMPPFAWSSFVLSIPSPPSYVPNIMSAFRGQMTFWQRILNTYYDLYEIMYYQWVILPQHREMVRKYIPGSPDLYDFIHNVSLVLVNAHPSVTDAVPRAPHVIEIGGLHIEAEKNLTLPKDLKDYLDNSKNGVILFSLGSNVKSALLPRDKRDAILKAFSKLKQNVIWKWEADNLPGQPPNVKIMRWVPQPHILAHPNTVGFISHGGLQSTIESIYFGVPIVGIPIFMDQKMNVATAVSRGYAVAVPIQELTEDKLYEAINRILHEPKYREVAKERSRIMWDKPRKSLDEAIYWIEYVIRHKGAPHLKYAGAQLTWYQRYLLDVVAAAISIFIVILLVLKALLRNVFKKKNIDTKKKKN